MHDTLAKLLELQRSDQALVDTRNTRDQLHTQLAGAKQALAEAQAGVEAAHRATQEAQAATHKLELDLQEREAEIEKLSLSLNKASSNKEYQAILVKQGTLKAENGRLEEEVLISMDVIEEREREEEAARAVQREAEAVLRAAEQKVEATRAELEKAMQEEEARRGELAADVPDDALRKYERILSGNRASGVAVVPVHGEYCQGCQMRILPQELSDLIGGSRIVICRTCQRILVLES